VPQSKGGRETPNAHAMGLSAGISKRDDTLPMEAVPSPKPKIDPVFSNSVGLP
jgi:hypothetical protein